jgi:hypothetical protein
MPRSRLLEQKLYSNGHSVVLFEEDVEGVARSLFLVLSLLLLVHLLFLVHLLSVVLVVTVL